jgi:putative two-component system response regulator
MKVVVVDDNAINLTIVATLAARVSGTEVVTYACPVRALAWLAAADADLVIVDYMMPEMDGIAFIERFRAMPDRGSVPVVMVTASADRETRHRALEVGATDFLTKPVDPVELKARMANLLALRAAHRQLADRASWLADAVARATADLHEREREVIWRLSMAAEHRDRDTAYHVVRVAEYAGVVAEGLGLDADMVRQIRYAAPMHDVGKVGIPDAVLLKPGQLEPDEIDRMKAHTIIGGRILAESSSPLIRLAAEIALTHHERFDGRGYPYGRAGSDIPLCGRIVAVADVFDALTSERPYKRAWTTADAFAHIEAERGRQFDPACVDAFLAGADAVLGIRARFCDTNLTGPILIPA